jgi:hypothetical protein
MHQAWLARWFVAAISVIGVAMRPAHGAEMRAEHPASTASGPSPQSSAALIRRLPPLSKGSRLSGEEASMVAPVYVTGRQVDARARFRLGALSSVSVLPESGTLTVSVNGAEVKAVPVGAAYGLRVAEFDIPAGLLRQGWNAVGIAAHHRHRVDCSVDAANELWTRVDPAESGLMFADAATGFPDVADIAAIGPRPDGAVPVICSGRRTPSDSAAPCRASSWRGGSPRRWLSSKTSAMMVSTSFSARSPTSPEGSTRRP